MSFFCPAKHAARGIAVLRGKNLFAVIQRESVATRAPVSSGHNAADVTAGTAAEIAADAVGSIAGAAEAVTEAADDLNGDLPAGTIAGTMADTHRSGGHN